jgi:hypothetical protein
MIKDKIAENATLKWPKSRKITRKLEIVVRALGLAGRIGIHAPRYGATGCIAAERRPKPFAC